MTKPTRKERTPVNGARDILVVREKDPNYEYRFVLDVPGRIQKFLDGGWEAVTEKLEVGQNVVDKGSNLGSAVTKHAGRGQMYVLMRIPKEWYDEDQLAKQEKVDAVERAMMVAVQNGQFPGSGSNEQGSYVPASGGLQITRRR